MNIRARASVPALLAALALGLTGCSGGGAGDAGDTITVWGTWDMEDEASGMAEGSVALPLDS